MFNLFNRKPNPAPEPVQEYQDDALGKEMTKIAVALIENTGGPISTHVWKETFLKMPSLINDVAPEYRQRLLDVLKEE